MRFGALLLALVLACAAPAWAAPAFVQGKGCGTSNCVALTAFPTNGNLMVVILDNTTTFAGVTVKDSNSVALTIHQPSGNCVSGNSLCVAIFDYGVTGSPGKTYTITGLTGVGFGASAYIEEISGATNVGANYAANAVASMISGATLIATIAGVTTTDAQLALSDAVAATGSIPVTLSNGSNVACGGGGSTNTCALATATTSSTATLTSTGGTATSAVVGYADYPAGSFPGGGGSTCGPYPYPCLFRPAYVPPLESWCWLCA